MKIWRGTVSIHSGDCSPEKLFLTNLFLLRILPRGFREPLRQSANEKSRTEMKFRK
jgi:hypothetical protein